MKILLASLLLLSSVSHRSIIAMDFGEMVRRLEDNLRGHGPALLGELEANTATISTTSTKDIHRCENAIDSFISLKDAKKLTKLLQQFHGKKILPALNSVSIKQANNFLVNKFIQDSDVDGLGKWLEFCSTNNMKLEESVASAAREFFKKRKETELDATNSYMKSAAATIALLKKYQKQCTTLGANGGSDSGDEDYATVDAVVKTMKLYETKKVPTVTPEDK